MKKFVSLSMATVFILLLVACQPRVENEAPSIYSGPAVSGELQSGWKKTTIPEVESLLGVKLPVPTYLPSGYGIKEVYYGQDPNARPQIITYILLLISDQPVEWTGNQYTCRLALEIGWNKSGLGLKMPWAEYIPAVDGRLEEEDNEYVLWWESYSSPEPLGSTLRLYSSKQFLKEELVKIAESTRD